MDISTIAKLAIRATTLGALALAILATSANTSLAQIPYTTTLPTLAGSPFIILEPTVAPGPDSMTVNILNGQFSSLAPGTGLSITMLDGLPGQQFPSDLILFDNTGLGGTAMITFLSDDELGRLPAINTIVTYTALPPVLEPASALVTIPIKDLIGGVTYTLTATMFSDGDPASANQLSDFMTLSIPEPSTVSLAGLALAALAGLAYRRRRTPSTA
jgi:MYXO-CTERM domain-containing protein